MAKKLIYIDTETTGLHKQIHGIIQLAYMIEIDGELVEVGDLAINPHSYVRDIQVTAKALEINGYTEEDFQGFGSAKVACDGFVQTLNKYIDRWDKNDKFLFVGFNSEFDMGFITEWFKDSGYDTFGMYIDYRHLDVLALVKYLVHLGKIDTGTSMSLMASCKALNIPLQEEDAHNALADIVATRELHLKLIREYM